ncbi:hypothetical protein [Streptacidiphilus cavernicola]|uniref:Secreted protein n=1 Tax=Streptacidiphilus cavernicola TaxID=3342716 RepID=A0ABV6VTG7_9ACTN
MSDGLLNVILGVVSSAISAGAAWALQSALRRRRLNRTREFFGLPRGSECLLVVPHKAGVTVDRTVGQRDAYALMELAALVRECGAEAEIVAHNEVHQGIGGKAEFCIGGPAANDRMAAHLRWRLPGVAITTEWDETGLNQLLIGDQVHLREKGRADYVALGRIVAGQGERPTFLVCGQTATSNLAAVRYLTRHHHELMRRYSTDTTFCLLLRVVQADAYGADVVELVGDVTGPASAPRPAAPVPAESAAPGSPA